MMSVDNDADESIAANCGANHARLTRGHWRHGIVKMGVAADASFKACLCLIGRAIGMTCRNHNAHIDDLLNGIAWHHFRRKRQHHRHISLAQDFQRFKRGCIHRADKFDTMRTLAGRVQMWAFDMQAEEAVHTLAFDGGVSRLNDALRLAGDQRWQYPSGAEFAKCGNNMRDTLGTGI